MSEGSKTLKRLIGKHGSMEKHISRDQKSSQPLDLVLMFDTTASMSPYLEQVRRKLSDLAGEVFQSVKNTRIGVIAYVDYDNYDSTNVTKVKDLTDDISSVKHFLENVVPIGGHDIPEAVEEALFEANQLSWRIGSRRAAVLVGDAPPHGVVDAKSECRYGHFYVDEARNLAQKGIHVYTVQCGNYEATQRAFQLIANETDGKHLFLENSDDLVELLVAISMKEVGLLETYTERLESQGRLTDSKKRLLAALKKG